ncbi:hypothetical protein V8C86DRAFT_2682689 [Haematococcus lacustris]
MGPGPGPGQQRGHRKKQDLGQQQGPGQQGQEEQQGQGQMAQHAGTKPVKRRVSALAAQGSVSSGPPTPLDVGSEGCQAASGQSSMLQLQPVRKKAKLTKGSDPGVPERQLGPSCSQMALARQPPAPAPTSTKHPADGAAARQQTSGPLLSQAQGQNGQQSKQQLGKKRKKITPTCVNVQGAPTQQPGSASAGRVAPRSSDARSRGNPFVSACLAEPGSRQRRAASTAKESGSKARGNGDGGSDDIGSDSDTDSDDWSDLEDFIVCQPGRDYKALIAARFKYSTGEMEPGT